MDNWSFSLVQPMDWSNRGKRALRSARFERVLVSDWSICQLFDNNGAGRLALLNDEVSVTFNGGD